jgi:hypothetical protein
MTKRIPFRYFKTSPEIIRLTVMMYVRSIKHNHVHGEPPGVTGEKAPPISIGEAS